MLRNLLLGTVLSTAAAIGSANALIIDTFNEPNSAPFQQTCVGGSGTSCPVAFDSSLRTGFSQVIGGQRLVETTLIAAPNSGSSTTFISSAFSPFYTGAFVHSQDPNVIAKSQVTWNGGGALDANLLADGAMMFQFGIAQADAGLLWRLEVCDTAAAGGDCAFKTFATATDITLGSPEVRNVTFADLLLNNANLNLDHVAFIRFTANDGGVANLDTTIDDIRTVPEPMTMTMLGMGLAGLGLVARRRRNKAA